MSSRTHTPEPQSPKGDPEGWLMLVYQLPAKPAYFRVKIHRRLKAIGAVAVKNSVNVLPDNDDTREDFHWLKKEIEEGGGEAMIIDATLISGLTNQAVVQLFTDARSADYFSLADDVRNELKLSDKNRDPGELTNLVRKIQNRLDAVVELDFFDANGRETVNGLLSQLKSSSEEKNMNSQNTINMSDKNLHGRTWVTRTGIRVDRIASAWLISRFIDDKASFKYVAANDYVTEKGELRFDMYEAEYTHEGSQCTFEVLLGLIQPANSALRAIADIIHDLDIKDARYGRMENAGVKSLIEGICLANDNDDKRLERGCAELDDLYLYFQHVSS